MAPFKRWEWALLGLVLSVLAAVSVWVRWDDLVVSPEVSPRVVVIPQNSSVVVPLVVWNPHHPRVVDFFVRTYPADASWLLFMLRSIERFVPRSMYRNVIITYNESDHAFFSSFLPVFNMSIVLSPRVDPHISYGPNNGAYHAQMYAKLFADTHSDADYFIHIDSDVLFKRPVNLEDFMDSEGRVYLFPTKFDDLPKDSQQWLRSSEAMLQEAVREETMTRLPLIYPRDTYQNLRNRVVAIHDKSFLAALLSLDFFNEFTPLGAILMKHMPDRWALGSQKLNADWFAIQMWSWGGLDPSISTYLECVLRAPHYSQCKKVDLPVISSMKKKRHNKKKKKKSIK